MTPQSGKNGRRVYGAWAGRPKGTPEDTTRCVEEIWGEYPGSWHQCHRKRGHGKDGLYCKQHAKRNPAEGVT